MCGIEMHGFWWPIENAMREHNYEVVFALEVNSHSRIKKQYTIPKNAYALGINPINGKVVTNDSQAPDIPEQVIEKAELFFQMYRPNKETIAEHIRMNYAKNSDKEEWDRQLPEMLSDKGRELFSARYYEQQARYYEQQARYCEQQARYYEQQARDWEQWARDWEQRARDWEQRARYWEQRARYYEQRARYWEQRAREATGSLDTMDIDKFIAYFLEHPNDYWKERKEPRRVEYKSFVKV